MDQVPGCVNLYISGLAALDQPDLLEQKGITHILTILEFDYCDYEEFSHFRRLLILAEDSSGQNLLQFFAATNAFIDEGLAAAGGAVLVHCAMGQSRSATVVCAYLMRRFGGLTAGQAVERLREARPVCEPNGAFVGQLEVFGRMLGAAGEGGARAVYLEWEGGRSGGGLVGVEG
ncbi:hypothetical protein LTR36_006495 [Oleoguttula mirabilis]|uniref:protein-tyrosine-phosphatase n=1 Tax=Oleoguttula mirabilis TaxID=1507867 RepID=A0AAV9JV74_9PEZI|nr:hypothetical protein LTR36_006495 [Oleoguttula mirabilis]